MLNSNQDTALKAIIEKDSNLRQVVADYYMSLLELNDPPKSIELLAGHVAMLVEMINDFKKKT